MNLKPCPLCRGAAALRANFYATHVHIECQLCGLFTHERPIADQAAVINLWQRRDASETQGRSMGAHYGVELKPSEIEAAGLDELLRDRLEDAARDIAYNLAPGGGEDLEAHDREVREHILAHAKERGLKVSIHIHDPLRMAPVTG